MNRAIAGLVVCFSALVWIGPPALAREAVVGMDERVFNIVNDAQVLFDEEDLEGALQVLNEAFERRMTGYETAQVLRLTGLIHYQAERLQEAIGAYEEALAQEDLPDSMIGSLLGSLARLNLMEDRSARAEELLRRLLTLRNQNTADNRVLLASALMRQEKFEEALVPLESAIAEARADGRQPSENWLSMLASIFYSLEDLEAMRTVVRELAEIYPREQYLMNLAALHGQLGDRQKQLAVVEAMLDDDRIDQGRQLKMLASLFLAEELPHKAARVLDTGLADGRIEADSQTLELLSQAWYLAQEFDRAIPPLERAAAMAETGELYMRLAGLHMDAYQWPEAESAAEQALAAGGLKQEGRAWLIRGMAAAQLERFDAAEDFFERAQGYDSTRKYADQWLNYVASERRTRTAAIR